MAHINDVSFEKKQKTKSQRGKKHLHGNLKFKTVVIRDRCVEVICTGRHTTSSLETTQIYSCTKTPGARPCCDSTVL